MATKSTRLVHRRSPRPRQRYEEAPANSAFGDGETRTRTGDTTICGHHERSWSYLAICSRDVAPRSALPAAEIRADTGGLPWVLATNGRPVATTRRCRRRALRPGAHAICVDTDASRATWPTLSMSRSPAAAGAASRPCSTSGGRPPARRRRAGQHRGGSRTASRSSLGFAERTRANRMCRRVSPAHRRGRRPTARSGTARDPRR